MTAAENTPPVEHLELLLSRVDGLSPDEVLVLRRNELSSAINLLTWRAQQEARGVPGASEGFREALDYVRAVATEVEHAKDIVESRNDNEFDRTRPLRLVSNAAIDSSASSQAHFITQPIQDE